MSLHSLFNLSTVGCLSLISPSVVLAPLVLLYPSRLLFAHLASNPCIVLRGRQPPINGNGYPIRPSMLWDDFSRFRLSWTVEMVMERRDCARLALTPQLLQSASSTTTRRSSIRRRSIKARINGRSKSGEEYQTVARAWSKTRGSAFVPERDWIDARTLAGIYNLTAGPLPIQISVNAIEDKSLFKTREVMYDSYYI